MKGFRIARIFGIDIEIHYSLLLIFGLIVYFLTTGYFANALAELSFALRVGAAIVAAILFIFSIIFHEMAHSLTARKFNIRTKRITLFMFGGMAQLETKQGFGSPSSEFVISIVGPISSCLLAWIFLGLAALFGSSVWLLAVLSWLFTINLILAVFNLIPAFPMDGGRIFRSTCWWLSKNLLKATKIARGTTMVFGILLPVGGYFLGGWFTAVWIAIISWLFLIPAAKTEYQAALFSEKLKGVRVEEIMERGSWFQPAVLRAEVSCAPQDLIHPVLERMIEVQKAEFYVVEDGKIIGRITFGKITQYVAGGNK